MAPGSHTVFLRVQRLETAPIDVAAGHPRRRLRPPVTQGHRLASQRSPSSAPNITTYTHFCPFGCTESFRHDYWHNTALMPTWPFLSPNANVGCTTKATVLVRCYKSKSTPLPVLQSSSPRSLARSSSSASFPLTYYAVDLFSFTVGIVIISIISGYALSCENRVHEAARVAACCLPRGRIRYCDHNHNHILALSCVLPPSHSHLIFLLFRQQSSLPSSQVSFGSSGTTLVSPRPPGVEKWNL